MVDQARQDRLFKLIMTLYLENYAIIMLPLGYIGNDFVILLFIGMDS